MVLLRLCCEGLCAAVVSWIWRVTRGSVVCSYAASQVARCVSGAEKEAVSKRGWWGWEVVSEMFDMVRLRVCCCLIWKRKLNRRLVLLQLPHHLRVVGRQGVGCQLASSAFWQETKSVSAGVTCRSAGAWQWFGCWFAGTAPGVLLCFAFVYCALRQVALPNLSSVAVADLQAFLCMRGTFWLCLAFHSFFSGRLRSCRWCKVARWGAARPDACACCVCRCCGADRTERPFQVATSKSI